jgi:nitrogen fixation protein FixH
MKQAQTQPRPFTGWHMIGVMGVFFGVIIGVNVTLAVLANKTWSGLIVANGYDASQTFAKEEARARSQALLGWQTVITHDNDVLGVAMLTKDSRPLAGLKVSGTLRRTVTDKQDMALIFSESAGGLYSAPAKIASGKWELEIDAADTQGHSFIQTYRFKAKGD